MLMRLCPFLVLVCICRVIAAAPPATSATPLTLDEIVDRAVVASSQLATVEKETQIKLKALASVTGREADLARQELLMKRRLIDRQAWVALRRLKLHFLRESLPPNQRKSVSDLSDSEIDLLLDARTAEQRLAVPLRPMRFDKATVEDVFKFIRTESEIELIADWPALTQIGVSKIDVVTLDVGRYDKPAMQTLQDVLSAVGLQLAVLRLEQPDVALVTTAKGLERLAELDALLAQRVRDASSWAKMPVLAPVSFTEMPFGQALDTAVGAGPSLELQWDRLAAAGVTTMTPVSLTLGVHRFGHALGGITDVLSQTPTNRGKAPIVFDRTADGVTVVSTRDGLNEAVAAADRIASAAAGDRRLAEALAAHLPEVNVDGVKLGDLVATVNKETDVRLVADWSTLAATGLTPTTPITMQLLEPPVSQVLRLMFTPASGAKATVQWKMQDGVLLAGGNEDG